MSVTIKSRTVFIAVLIVFILIFASGWWLGWKRGDNANKTHLSERDTIIQRLVLKIHEDSLYVVQIGQEVTTLKEAIKKGELDKAELKALNLKYVSEVTQIKGRLKILKDSIANTGNVIIVTDCDTTTEDTRRAIELPFTFKEHNKWYQMDGAFNIEGKMNIALTVPMQVDVWTGWDKTAKKYKAVVTTLNPNVVFNGVNSLKLDLQKPKKYSIGLFMGYGMTIEKTPTLAPMVGIGVSRSLIRF